MTIVDWPLRISDTVVIPILQTLLPWKAILTGLAIFLTVCILHYFLVTRSCEIQVYQAAKDISADDALVDFLELNGRYLKHLDAYTRIVPIPPMHEIVVMIIVELLNVLALVTKELMQGPLSASSLPDLLPHLMERSEFCKEASQRAGRRGIPKEARSTRQPGSSGDRIADS